MLFHLPEISFPLPFPGALYVSPVLFSPSLITFYCHNLVIRPLIPRNGQIPQNSDCFLQFCSVFYRTLFEVLFLNILLFNFTVVFFFFISSLSWICMCCYCSVTQLYPTLCNAMDCSSQASLSLTISWSLPKVISIALVMPSLISSFEEMYVYIQIFICM